MTREKSFFITRWRFLDKVIQKWRMSLVDYVLLKNRVVCDLGCGFDATFLIGVKKIIKRGIGVDISVDRSIKEDNLDFIECNLNNDLPIDSNSIDIVTSFAVLEHLDDYEKHLSEIFRILDGDRKGILFLTTPSPSAKPVLDTLAFLGLIDSAEIKDHKRYFSSKMLLKILMDQGFVDVEIKNFQFGFNNLVIARKK